MNPLQILDKACDWAFRFYSKKYSIEALDLKNLNDKNNNSKSGRGVRGSSNKFSGPTGNSSSDFAAGSAYLRIHEFVSSLIKKNDLAKKKEDKVFINQTYLAKHQGSNRDAIKGYLHLHAVVLDKHHRKHDLNPRHNVEVNTYLGKIEKIGKPN